jgi:hypothetical protein
VELMLEMGAAADTVAIDARRAKSVETQSVLE